MNSRVAAWYNIDANAQREDSRLVSGRVELSVTRHFLQKYIVAYQQATGRGSLRIADIRCGTGVYAIPLAQQGHEVTISDISSTEIALAQDKARSDDVFFQAAVAADACRLRNEPLVYRRGYYDLQLWLGPLYHILDDAQQVQAILTALDMAAPGGYIAIAFVTMHAHLRDLATREPDRLCCEADFYHVNGYLADGKYMRGQGASMVHTTVPRIRRLMENVQQVADGRSGGFEVEEMVSCEGFLGYNLSTNLATVDDAVFDKWMEVILASATDETTLGCADHVLVFLRKTDVQSC